MGVKTWRKKIKKKQHLKSFIKEKTMKNAKFLSTERKKNYKLSTFLGRPAVVEKRNSDY